MATPARIGRTPDGTTFHVPHTPDMFHALASPARFGPAELLTHCFLLTSLLSVFLTRHLPLWLYIFAFAFWRIGYNVGLALLLHVQSTSHAVTSWLAALSKPARALVHWASARSVPSPYRWDAAPDAFNAWLAFRALATVVLANDGMSYFALVAASWRPLSDSRLSTLLLAIPTGVALVALSFWSKHKAHVALGDFAWFWGDFFFTIDGELVLNGVFELFPHPMYTVGYAGYYGAALISRSYTLLLVSLLAHVAQLVFLALVEEPHIRKIYGKPPETADDQSCSPDQSLPVEAIVQPPSDEGKEPSAYEEFTTSAPQIPVLIAIVTMFTTLVSLFLSARPSPVSATFAALEWRVVHWAGCALLLQKAEDGSNAWMRWFRRRGSSNAQAYSNWQLIFLVSNMVNHALFVVAALSFRGEPGAAVRQSWVRDWSLTLGGGALIAVALLSMASAWSVIGSFGFYYGDFFVTPENRELHGRGVFRYVTNPEVSLGYLAYYGLALVRQSSRLFALAVFCQTMHMLFVLYIEEPHIEREYKLVQRRTALENSVRSLPLIGVFICAACDFVKHVAEKVHQHGENHFDSVSKQATVKLEKFRADLNKKSSTLWDKHVVQRATELKDKAECQTGLRDCEKVISMLERRGVVVERVGNSVK